MWRQPSEWEEVIPVERYNTHIFPETGSHLCETVGTYVLMFDNTYSLMRSKTVSYSVDVSDPVAIRRMSGGGDEAAGSS